MGHQLSELLDIVNGKLIGKDIEINGVGGADNAGQNEITFAQNKDYLQLAIKRAGAVLITEKLADRELEIPMIVVENPRLAFAKIANEFMSQKYQTDIISDESFIDSKAKIGNKVSIHSGVVIEAGAQIADNVILAPGVYIGENVEVGQGSVIYPNVVIEHDCKIGQEVEINAGTVIGSEGFGFEEDKSGYVKVPQFGNVIIEDNVEIGANVAIDRGATGSTIVGRSTKIDNLVHIAHNVEVGPECLLVGQVGIAGSTKIDKKVTLAGQSGVVGHVSVGANTTLAAKSVITHDIEPNSFVSGYPAHNHSDERRIKAARKRLPDMVKKVRKLENKIAKLEEKLK